ncbi:hypothetical protein PILCRDRAFT_93144 [Piloderma croceum F 1598]|uniref:Uncharacterized protein n=1 Tax=Piloderma croceum (strain F 1598) TaxID=765440 RepID=A0A0C3AHG1_PILCF|nr:hypothetical protein PILCRDRAFT_93144 [Piloderma croceum F 1598]
MSSDGVFIDEYIEWENNLDPVTEQLLPPWVLLARAAFQNTDEESREWLIEKMYATFHKFYCECVHVFVQATSRHYYMTRVFVPENWNIQGQHLTSPIMSMASWDDDNGTPKPLWACENRVNSVHGEIRLCQFMVPIYHAWAELDENALLPQPPLSARAVTPDNSETRWDRVEMVMERPHKLRVELEGARVHVKPLEF